MLRKGLIASVFAAMVTFSASAADVVIRLAPPAPIVEHRAVAPGPEYVWTPGYHRWDGRAYVWIPGSWVRPPHPHARWVAGHYVRRYGGWVFVDGHWR